jgi:hypothetical protein
MPFNAVGTYYVHVKTDEKDESFEGIGGNTDNIATSDTIAVRTTPPSDLEVNNILHPQSIPSASNLAITYTVINNSSVPSNISSWTDLVYLSLNPVFTLNDAILLGKAVRTSSLAGNKSYTNQLNLPLPKELAGSYYVYVIADAYDLVNEFGGPGIDLKSNNLKRSSNPVLITESPTPDLVTTLARITPQNLQADSIGNLTVIIKNQGNGQMKDASSFLLELVEQTTGKTVKSYTSFTIPILKEKDSVRLNQPLLIPPVANGNYFFRVKLDPKNLIFERESLASKEDKFSLH